MGFSNQRIAGTILFAGSVGFILAMNVAEWLYPSPPGYSSSQNFISDLGATCRSGTCHVYQPTSMIFNTSIIALGILIISGSYFLYRGYKKKVFSGFMILSGIGAIGVGIFPESYGNLHSIVSLIVFLFGGLAAIVSLQILRRPFNYFSIILGLITLASLGLYTTKIFLGLGPGGMERMIAYPALLWLAGLGGYMLSAQDSFASLSAAAKP